MRRIRTLFSIAMIIATFSNFSNAQKAASFRIEPTDISGKEGDTVTIKVFAKDFKNVLGLQFSVGWDTTKFRNITKTSTVYNNSHSVITNEFVNCFNSRPFAIYMAFTSSSLTGSTITPNEESILYFFNLILKSDCQNESVCFSKHMDKELIYHTDTEDCITQNYPKYSCNSIDFNLTKLYLVSSPNDITVDNNTTSVKLSVKAYGGKTPYTYDWGSIKNIDNISITPPTKDTVIYVKVYDALNDSAESKIFIYTDKSVKDEYINIQVSLNTKDYTLTLNPIFGTSPYNFDWSEFNIPASQLNTITFPIPLVSTYYKVKVTDSKGIVKKYIIYLNVLKFKFYSISYNKFKLEDTLVRFFANTDNGVYPYKYKWDNNDTTSYSIRKSIGKDSLFSSVTITDSFGQVVSGSKTIYRDIKKYLNYYSFFKSYNDNYYSFNKNPESGLIKYKAAIYQKNNLVFTDSGSTLIDYFKLNYTNESFFDTAYLYLTYSLEHLFFPIKDTTVLIKILKKPVTPIVVSTGKYNFCKIDTLLILKPIVSGGAPPYHYNWGDLGAGEGIDWMPVEVSSSKNYSITITDKVGQKKVSDFIIVVGEKSIINNVTYSSKENCSNADFTIKVDKNDYSKFLFKTTIYDKNWNQIYNSYENIYDFDNIKYSNGLFSNTDISNLVIKIKAIGNHYFCEDPNAKEFIDTLRILPAPNFEPFNIENDTLCEGSIVNMNTPLQSATNLPNVKYEWKVYNNIDNKKEYSDKPFANYLLNSSYKDIYQSFYQLDYVMFGAKLTYTNTGCFSENNFIRINIVPKPKFSLYNKLQTVTNNDEITPIIALTNLDNINYKLSYINNNLTGSLLDDKDFPLTGKLVNNSNHSQKLAIIVKSSLFGCEGQTDTAYIEVTKGINEHVELSSSDEFTTIYNKSHRNLVDDLGVDFEYLLSPNPASNELNFSFKANSSTESTLGIYSISGQQMMEIPFEAQKGVNKVRFSIEKLPAGNYILLFKNNENVKTERFVKQ